MNAFGFATLTATALTAAVIGLAGPAAAAPAGASNAQDTVSQLQDRGVRVVIDRQGPVGPLSQADVTSVRIDAEDNVAYVNVR